MAGRREVADFAVQGAWHCRECAQRPLAVYTTWVALSLATPMDSVLAVVPGSHLLQGWDLPLRNAQLPGEFDGQAALWQIPPLVNPGDVIIFNIKTVHGASRNNSRPKRFRVSCDARMQVLLAPPTE